MSKNRWNYRIIGLLLGLCISFSGIQISAAEEIVGGQVMTEGEITFYEEPGSSSSVVDSTDQQGSRVDLAHGSSSDTLKPEGRFPSTGERILTISFWLGGVLALLGLILLLLRKEQENE